MNSLTVERVIQNRRMANESKVLRITESLELVVYLFTCPLAFLASLKSFRGVISDSAIFVFGQSFRMILHRSVTDTSRNIGGGGGGGRGCQL